MKNISKYKYFPLSFQVVSAWIPAFAGMTPGSLNAPCHSREGGNLRFKNPHSYPGAKKLKEYNHLRPGAILIICLLFITINTTTLAQSTKEIERAGDVLQIALPLTAYGMTHLFDDHQGRRNFSNTFLFTMGTTYTLKYSIPRERPGGGDLSFVSGHTSAAFSSATFIQRRYGWKYGIPAYLCASFVGWSRVRSKKHYTDDVLRGAALGLVSAYIFTKPYKGTLVIAPFVEDRTIGVTFQGSW